MLGRIITFMISGFFAEFIGSSFLAPFEAARIRLVTNPKYATGVVRFNSFEKKKK